MGDFVSNIEHDVRKKPRPLSRARQYFKNLVVEFNRSSDSRFANSIRYCSLDANWPANARQKCGDLS